MIENLESESDDTEVQVATLDMSIEEHDDSPIPGQVSRPSIIDLAETMCKSDAQKASGNKLKFKTSLRYSFSKSSLKVSHSFRSDTFVNQLQTLVCDSGSSNFGQCS